MLTLLLEKKTKTVVLTWLCESKVGELILLKHLVQVFAAILAKSFVSLCC